MKINKVANKDFKFLIQWLHANKISLKVAKTEVIIFRRKKKQLDFDLNLNICGKKLQASSYVKYLGYTSTNILISLPILTVFATN